MARNKSGLNVSVRQQRPNPLVAQFDCAGGEVLALVGPSGSGKSSLLRLIAGLARPEQGCITCGSEVWLDTEAGKFLAPQARHVGYVPQNYGLFPHLSAGENIRAGIAHLPAPEQAKIAQDWMERVQLGGLQDRRPHQLSGGQQQRVAVARALARNPSVLLLDEPFSATDSVTREGLYLQLAELKQQLSIPIVMVTHDLQEATLLANRIALLLEGRLLQTGRPDEVMSRPVTEQAARQVGIRNFFDGELVGHDPARDISWLQAGTVRLASPYRPELREGDRVTWIIPHSGVRVRAMFRDDLADDLNRICVRVDELLPLGNTVQLKATIEGVRSHLHTTLPRRLASELNLHSGAAIEVILKHRLIHVLRD